MASTSAISTEAARLSCAIRPEMSLEAGAPMPSDDPGRPRSSSPGCGSKAASPRATRPRRPLALEGGSTDEEDSTTADGASTAGAISISDTPDRPYGGSRDAEQVEARRDVEDLLTAEAVERVLGCSEEVRSTTLQLTREIRRALRDRMQAHHLQIHDIYLGGSFRKNTNLGYSFDVDLVMTLGDYKQSRLGAYMALAVQAVSQAFKGSHGTQKCDNCVRINIPTGPGCTGRAGGLLELDLLVTGDARDAQDDAEVSRCFRAKLSRRQDDYMVDAMKRYPGLRHLILLAKHWVKRYPQRWPSIAGPRSYLIELLCLQVLQSMIEHGLQPTVAICFQQFLSKIAYCKVTSVADPVHPDYVHDVNVADEELFLDYARETHDRLFGEVEGGEEGSQAWESYWSGSWQYYGAAATPNGCVYVPVLPIVYTPTQYNQDACPKGIKQAIEAFQDDSTELQMYNAIQMAQQFSSKKKSERRFWGQRSA